MTVIVPLTKGYEAIVDDCDAERVMAFSWHVQFTRGNPYAVRKFYNPRRSVFLHSFILQPPLGMQVDHKNYDGLDCRRENMRIATRSQNSAYRRSAGGVSGFRGVFPYNGRWVVKVGAREKRQTVGVFSNKEEAARSYDNAALAMYGEFAILNFPLVESAA